MTAKRKLLGPGTPLFTNPARPGTTVIDPVCGSVAFGVVERDGGGEAIQVRVLDAGSQWANLVSVLPPVDTPRVGPGVVAPGRFSVVAIAVAVGVFAVAVGVLIVLLVVGE